VVIRATEGRATIRTALLAYSAEYSPAGSLCNSLTHKHRIFPTFAFTTLQVNFLLISLAPNGNVVYFTYDLVIKVTDTFTTPGATIKNDVRDGSS
jgi:hypothetical protein